MQLSLASCASHFTDPWVAVAVLGAFGALFLLAALVDCPDVRARRVVFAACTAYAIYLCFLQPFGKQFNYMIYSYNAELTLEGLPAFGRQNPPEQLPSYALAYFMDYTGAQHLLYVGLEFLSRELAEVSTAFGFRLYHFFWYILSLVLLYKRARGERGIGGSTFTAALLVFHFAASIVFIVGRWEDKLVFFGLPLAIVCLLERKSLFAAAALIGAAATFNGISILFLPSFVIYCAQVRRSLPWRELLVLLIAAGLLMLPFFPESLSGWHYRSQRLAIPEPFWFSIFLPVKEIYFPQLPPLAQGITAILCALAITCRRMRITVALGLSVAALLTFSSFNASSRIVPPTLLLLALVPNLTASEALRVALALAAHALIQFGFSPANITNFHVFLAHLPLLYVIWLLYRKSHTRRSVTGVSGEVSMTASCDSKNLKTDVAGEAAG